MFLFTRYKFKKSTC